MMSEELNWEYCFKRCKYLESEVRDCDSMCCMHERYGRIECIHRDGKGKDYSKIKFKPRGLTEPMTVSDIKNYW